MAMVTARARALAMACVGGSGRPGRASSGDLLLFIAREGERRREASPRQANLAAARERKRRGVNESVCDARCSRVDH